MPSPNGIEVTNDGSLLISQLSANIEVGTTSLYKYNPTTQTGQWIAQSPADMLIGDGIFFDAHRETLYVSNDDGLSGPWAGMVSAVRSTDGWTTAVVVGNLQTNCPSTAVTSSVLVGSDLYMYCAASFGPGPYGIQRIRNVLSTLPPIPSTPPPLTEPEVMGAFASVTYTWNEEHTAAAYVARGSFIPTNNVIAGIKVHSGTTYLTVPRWRPGIPATLATLEASPAGEGSNVALLAPYPSWDMNTVGDCSRLQYVQSMEIVGDEMWVLDVGRINIFADDPSLISNKCPPKLVILSLRTTKGSGNPAAALLTYNFPDSVASHTASFLNDLVVDPARGIAYISDSGTGAIIAFSRDDLSSRRFADSTTLRNPAYEMVINGITYGTNKITTPVDGIALLPDGSRVVYCVVQGVQLWSVDARILADTSMGITQVQATQIYHGNKPSPSGGIAFDCTGTHTPCTIAHPPTTHAPSLTIRIILE